MSVSRNYYLDDQHQELVRRLAVTLTGQRGELVSHSEVVRTALTGLAQKHEHTDRRLRKALAAVNSD